MKGLIQLLLAGCIITKFLEDIIDLNGTKLTLIHCYTVLNLCIFELY